MTSRVISRSSWSAKLPEAASKLVVRVRFPSPAPAGSAGQAVADSARCRARTARAPRVPLCVPVAGAGDRPSTEHEGVENAEMPLNRSAPPASVIPVLTYPNVPQAVEWLVRVFGFVERVRIGDHRAQLSFGDGALIVADDSADRTSPIPGAGVTHSVMLRVDDIDNHYAIVQASGIATSGEPKDMPYGERQYSVTDPAGHRWTFTQSVTNVSPEDWGGQTMSAW